MPRDRDIEEELEKLIRQNPKDFPEGKLRVPTASEIDAILFEGSDRDERWKRR
jgi:hypothetical protein